MPKKELKRAQKAAPKKRAPKPPKITEEQFHRYFMKLDQKSFIQITKEWNEKNLKIKLTKQENYDDWLNYFKTLSPNTIKVLATTGMDVLPTEAYAALSRWHDIIGKPHRIDKIHQSGLTSSSGNGKKKTIAQLALDNDRLGVLQATRDKIAEKLDKGAGSRDTALLTREMTEIMTQIGDYEKRIGPKKSTVLGQLLNDMPQATPKRSKTAGARNTSFKSRVTIEDVEHAK